MSRRHNEENSFGSDSFLDVIANIVGILIILIVVAGVRVSRAPLLAIASPTQNEPHPIPETKRLLFELVDDDPGDSPILPDLVHERSRSKPALTERPQPDLVSPRPQPLPEIPQPQANPQVLKKIENLKSETTTLSERQSSVESQLASLSPESEQLAQELTLSSKLLEDSEGKLRQLLQLIDISKLENAKSQSVVDELQNQLREADRSEPPVDQLAHKLNPLGRMVTGSEVHFRLMDNKVSFVPVGQLSGLVKKDMQRRRDYLIKQPRFQSTVGPVNGYEMEYLVQRETNSLFDEARLGTGMIRIAVTDWVLRPTANVDSETFEVAIAPNSQFRAALVSEGTNATITFWVYPDSFELHRLLKELVHDSGFWVASRPLPSGFPIAGSASSGSKSIAQ